MRYPHDADLCLKGRAGRGRPPHDADQDQDNIVSQFAAQIGVTKSIVYRYLKGKTRPSGKTLRAVLATTEGTVNPADFLKPKRRCPTCQTPLARKAATNGTQPNKLAEFLQTKGLTRIEFADMIDVSPPTVGNYIRGERYPQVPTLRRIIQATSGAVSPEDMMNIGHYCDTCLAPVKPTHR